MKRHLRIVLIVCALIGAVLAAPPPAGAQVATCDGVEATLVGTEGDDLLVGTDGNDVIVGLGGNDIIRGLDGDDILCGDNGRDRAFGGKGDDRLFGGKKNDILKGDQGFDYLEGNQGNDRLFGGGAGDVLLGGSGARDRLFGKGGTSDTCDDPQGTTFVDTCETLAIRLPPTVNAVHNFYSQTVAGVTTSVVPANVRVQPGSVTSFWYRAGDRYAILLSGVHPLTNLCPGNSIQTTQTTFENVTNAPMANGLCRQIWLTATMNDTGITQCDGRVWYLTEIPIAKAGTLWSSINWIVGGDTSANGHQATLIAATPANLANTGAIDRSIMSC